MGMRELGFASAQLGLIFVKEYFELEEQGSSKLILVWMLTWLE
jgi:hypothetical protein